MKQAIVVNVSGPKTGLSGATVFETVSGSGFLKQLLNLAVFLSFWWFSTKKRGRWAQFEGCNNGSRYQEPYRCLQFVNGS